MPSTAGSSSAKSPGPSDGANVSRQGQRPGHPAHPRSPSAGSAPARSSQPPAQPGVVSLAPLTELASHYLSEADLRRIREAYRFSDHAHLGQFRTSGEPYISHPIAVAAQCAQWRLDGDALMAALLHDVMEDSGVRKEELIEKFGSVVASLVDGLSKLDKVEFRDREHQQAENFRKMLLAMARDVRVVLIKLADRLHNMRTLDAVPPHKRQRVARETMDIYAPIAQRLGLSQAFHELEDLSFSHLYPMRYRVLRKAVLAARGNRREAVSQILNTLRERLPNMGVKADVQGREKSVYSIYRKMADKHLTFSQIHDVYGFRILVDTQQECYLALGALHAIYRPQAGRFKDYIALPKENGYQSLHTVLLGPFGTVIECQIRTYDMHRLAETGVAAHWIYKADDADYSELQRRAHQWLKSLVDLQKDGNSPTEFLEHLKVDLFPDAVYVSTPRGEIRALPRGATPIDFAYSIHTDLGKHCVGAVVNGDRVALKTELKSGDVVAIETSDEGRPNPAWLSFVKTGKARSEIRHYLKTATFAEAVVLGQQLLDAALQALLQPSTGDIPASQWDMVLKDSGARSREELLADLGLGRRLPALIARLFVQRTSKSERRRSSPMDDAADRALNLTAQTLLPAGQVIELHGNEGMAVQFAPCCLPIPGDALTGHLRGGHGLVVHRDDCPTAKRQRDKDRQRWVDVRWADDIEGQYLAKLDVLATNERGLLGRVAAEIGAANANITNVGMDSEDNRQTLINFTVQVTGRIHLANVIRHVRRVSGVERVNRLKPSPT